LTRSRLADKLTDLFGGSEFIVSDALCKTTNTPRHQETTEVIQSGAPAESRPF